ncbi:PhnD/SsuA/transferrin family substrate-binding protein [Inhella gelatinilytica]|uniref:PhnD/SsuA/transferrin family substrate-binding protein n=1 Tax=Inhella gelatinilytica TaxID=2795030 RepID=A0A931NCJ4_9BURK|nr:PhnD/SsuA/transferrin family substrate-binding protein [Inhella gelatinilytica]MBH9552077.1 PhnD/SsuA/transferrin family substrate-binding protein [Inhella gelatinilytica]
MSTFGGVVFSLEGPHAPTSLADLSKYVVATPDTQWLGAYQMQAYEMLVQGLQPPDGRGVLRVGGNQRDVVYAVLDGRAAVGFVRTGLLEEMAALKLVDLQKIRILNAKTWRGFHLHVSTTLYPE